jgi:very-short-patch-repair endonuclease
MAGHGFSDRGALDLTSLEQRVQKALQELGLPFVPQLPTRTGFLIDYALPSLRVALEVDGPSHERTRRRDAFRDLQLAREGWRVVRVSYRDIEGAEDLKALLAERLGV